MYDFLNEKEFIYSRQNRKHFVFRNLNLPRPEWQEILDHFNRNVVTKSKVDVMLNLGFVFFDADKMPYVNDLVSEIKKMNDNKVSAHCYLSLLETSQTFGRHNDDSEVFFWQVQGKTRWVVEDQVLCEYELSSNDMIYIPKFMVHDVKPLGPRAGISIGIDPC